MSCCSFKMLAWRAFKVCSKSSRLFVKCLNLSRTSRNSEPMVPIRPDGSTIADYLALESSCAFRLRLRILGLQAAASVGGKFRGKDVFGRRCWPDWRGHVRDGGRYPGFAERGRASACRE